MTPTFSIVMPTRGRPAFVGRAIKSVLEQSFTDFELLILDNSPQPEKDRILALSKSDSRIVFVARGDTGVTDARRLGTDLSRGQLMSLMDSDDYWHPKRLERHLEVWSRNQIGLSWDRWAEVQGGLAKEFPQPFPEGLILPPRVALRLYDGNFIHASSGIVSVRFARTLGFTPHEIVSSDWTLFMRAAEYYPAFFIGETLSFKETDSPDRVTDTEAEGYLIREALAIRKWALLNRPRIYGMQYLMRRIRRIVQRL